MISEVDIRDWDHIDWPLQKDEDGRRRMSSLSDVIRFVEQVELLRDKQIKASQSKVCSLLRQAVHSVKQGS